MKIDAHQHFWRLSRGDYGWLTTEAHPRIFRDFEPADLAPLLRAAGIDRTVLVQAAPSESETAFLLDLAAASEFVGGVVGWIDLESAGAPERIVTLAASPKFVGLRPMLQDLPDDDWILRASLSPALDAMEAEGLRLDALVKPRHLPTLRRFLEARPSLPVVIDHAGKPDLLNGDLLGWSKDLTAIARDSSARCKVSGLVTEAGAEWTLAGLVRVFDIVVDAFGPSRLMWGSDWPMVNVAGGYSRWLEAAETLTAQFSAEEREWFFGKTAREFYEVAG